MSEIRDVVIIGGGPAGMSAAVYASRSELDTVIVEAGAPGGKLLKTSDIENFISEKMVNGFELANKMYEHALSFGAEHMYGNVVKLEDLGEYKRVTLEDGGVVDARAVVIATGTKEQLLNVPGEEQYSGRGISYCAVCDGAFFKDKEIAVIGGGNSALEEALYLSEICKKVYIIHRREVLRGDNVLIERVKIKDNIEIIYNSQVKEFVEENNKLEAIKLEIEGSQKILSVKACFIFIGYEPATKFLKKLDILDEKGYIIVDERGQTKIKGIYAAGDIIEKEAYQIVTSASDGALAAVACIKDLSR